MVEEAPSPGRMAAAEEIVGRLLSSLNLEQTDAENCIWSVENSASVPGLANLSRSRSHFLAAAADD